MGASLELGQSLQKHLERWFKPSPWCIRFGSPKGCYRQPFKVTPRKARLKRLFLRRFRSSVPTLVVDADGNRSRCPCHSRYRSAGSLHRDGCARKAYLVMRSCATELKLEQKDTALESLTCPSCEKNVPPIVVTLAKKNSDSGGRN